MTATILASGIVGIEKYFRALPDIAAEASALAVNQIATRSLTGLRKQMRAEVAFPAGYLESRLGVVQFATKGNAQAIIRGRDRPTSLARFAQGQTPENTRGRSVVVTVKPGTSQAIGQTSSNTKSGKGGAFLIRLRNGNIGLAVRLAAGETIRSGKGIKLADGLFLLYGPSVDQVFRGVADDQAEDIAQRLSDEWYRQFARLSSRG